MGDVALIDSATGDWIAGPLPDDTAISVSPAQELVALAPGYPDTMRYDPATKTCVAIVAPISSLAFIALFTLAEKLAAYASDDAAVRMTIGEAQAAGMIHLDDPRVADGLDLLAAANIIAPARIPEILAAQPPA
mgnify:FL=1